MKNTKATQPRLCGGCRFPFKGKSFASKVWMEYYFKNSIVFIQGGCGKHSLVYDLLGASICSLNWIPFKPLARELLFWETRRQEGLKGEEMVRAKDKLESPNCRWACIWVPKGTSYKCFIVTFASFCSSLCSSLNLSFKQGVSGVRIGTQGPFICKSLFHVHWEWMQ